MDYQTFRPLPDLEPLIKCYWTLEVPSETDPPRQRIIPDGCIEMIFILGDDVKRFTSEKTFIIQPRAMVLGQITEPFYVQPTGYVNSFAIRFYPYGFANFVTTPIKELANKETPIELLFEKSVAKKFEREIIQAKNTRRRIEVAETFLLSKLNNKTSIDSIVKSTIDAIFFSRGNASVNTILKDDLSKRRQLERKFLKQVGISPKQLGKVIRLQTALKILLNQRDQQLTKVAYESDYYDQAHFSKDFKEFTGTSPSEFLADREMELSSLFYTKD
jgi:hypothetical protein